MSDTSTWHVAGMTCEHCAAAVRAEVGALNGVRDVEVAVEAGEVVVHSDAPVSREEVAAAVAEAGYELV